MIRLLKRILLFFLAGLLLYFTFDVGRYFFYPDVAGLKTKRPGTTAFMDYRQSAWRDRGIKKKIKTSWVPMSRISPYVMKAVIISEDDKFWSHEGFDFEAMQKAMEKNVKRNKLFYAGGSTISQQLVKNLYLSPSKNPLRKIKEAILTWRIERNLSKRRILELYLNVAEWSDGLFGIGAAARHYYGKDASALSAREAAALAVVLPNPRRLKPDGSSRYVARQAERIHAIMVRRGMVIEAYDHIVSESDRENGKEQEDEKPDAIEGLPDESSGSNNLPEGLP
ncbi:MAG: monofunctional biosynthetic peptidoglycan transglycosylase [Smithellaceae bacterium]